MERRSRRRAITALLLAVGLLMPATVSAAPPDRGTDEALSFGCGLVEDGGVTAWLGAGSSTRFGSFAELFVWTGGAVPEVDPPTYASDFENQPTGSVDGNVLTVTVALVSPETGDPAGTAEITATFTGTGLVSEIDERFDFNNAFERVSGTVEEATVAGVVEVDPLEGDAFSIDFSGCSGEIVAIDYFATQPGTFVGTVGETHLACELETPLGSLILFAHESNDFSFTSLAMPVRMISGFAEQVDLSPAGASFEVQLFDDMTGEPLPNPATVDATFTFSHAEQEHNVRANGWEKINFDVYDVTGTLSIPDLDLELDLADCEAFTMTGRFKGTTQATGPKGKPAANDSPAGAIDLAIGDTVRTTTVGTVLEPEVEGSCVPFDEFFGLQFGHTLWYEITVPTTTEITLDTAGSHFDTVIAVYEAGAEPAEIACVDDVPTGDVSRTTNASVTFTAQAGTTYLVQVGGYAGEADRLRLTVR